MTRCHVHRYPQNEKNAKCRTHLDHDAMKRIKGGFHTIWPPPGGAVSVVGLGDGVPAAPPAPRRRSARPPAPPARHRPPPVGARNTREGADTTHPVHHPRSCIRKRNVTCYFFPVQ